MNLHYYKIFIIVFIASFSLYFIYLIRQYFKLKKVYGKRNAKKMFNKKIKLKYIIPDEESEKYESTRASLLNIGWDISVEWFYLIKYILAVCVALGGLLVGCTNINIAIENTYRDLNLGRSASENQLESTDELKQKEEELLEKVKNYLISSNLDPKNPIAVDLVESYIKAEGEYYESPRVLAKRMLIKLDKLNVLNTDPTTFVKVILYAFLSFMLPEVLIILKSYLIDGKKDWEVLHCMVTYSITACIPPCTTLSVIGNMQDVSSIYINTLEEFKNALEKGDIDKAHELVELIDDEDMEQVLETLILAEEIGVDTTVENIDDQLETKISWLDINSNMRRQGKISLAYIPLMIIILMLFNYLMYYLNLVNSLLIIDI